MSERDLVVYIVVCVVSLVDIHCLCSRFLYLPIAGCHWWKTGSKDGLKLTSRRTLWSWLWCLINILCRCDRSVCHRPPGLPVRTPGIHSTRTRVGLLLPLADIRVWGTALQTVYCLLTNFTSLLISIYFLAASMSQKHSSFTWHVSRWQDSLE